MAPSTLKPLVIAAVLAASGSAFAEQRTPQVNTARPWTGYIRVPNTAAAPPTNSSVSSRIVYMKRCPISAGCLIKAGNDDSRTDTSSIVNGERTIGEFKQDAAVWAATMACVRETFAPYDITVVDSDPGNVPHFMNVVGGKSADLGRSDITNAGGVAPFACGEIPNAITFTFDVYGPDALSLCWTSAQEIAHAFGLEHQFLQKDPMTYIQGDLPKRFRDVDSGCGTFALEACQCTGRPQNSYRRIVELFGPGAPTPPAVAIERPGAGKEVQPGFLVVIDAVDEVRIERVELYIDDVMVGQTMTPIADKFEIEAPELELGPHNVEVRAFDVQGTMGSATVAVNQGPPCTAAKGCTDDDVCVAGNCVPGPAAAGGLGSICQADTECASHRCADGGETYKHCVDECDLGNPASCPSEFECISAGADGVCWPNPDSGCCAASTGPHGPMLLGLGIAVVLLRRRRRR